MSRQSLSVAGALALASLALACDPGQITDNRRGDAPELEEPLPVAPSDGNDTTTTSGATLACSDVGPIGRCDGDALVRCDDGTPVTTDCATAGAHCAYQNDDSGYRCLAAGSVGTNVVAGTVQYEDRPVAPGELGDAVPAPVRGANIWVIRTSNGAELAHAVTANDGSYRLRYNASPGTSVRVTVGSSSSVAARPIRVVRNNGNTHGFSSSNFAAAAERSEDLLITEASSRAHAFNVFDTLVLGMDLTRHYGETTLSPLKARYQRGSNSGSYYQGGSNTMTIAGGSDDDGYDDVVILHEFGHYHQDEYGRSNSPGGSHPNSGGDDPRLAWGEGQATYIANAFLHLPYYIDTNYTTGGWYVELEDRIHAANANGSMSQYIYEWMVAELLWDAGDHGHDGDEDVVTGVHADVIGVTSGYFFDPAYQGRGHHGVDLVDWLDGWIWHLGTDACASMRALLDEYRFPYDFRGPVSCP